MPLADWFSITTEALSALPRAGAAARVMASTPEPVALGRMNDFGAGLGVRRLRRACPRRAAAPAACGE